MMLPRIAIRLALATVLLASALPAFSQPVFIENRGQWDSRVRFLLRTDGLDTWITGRGVVYDLHRMTGSDGSDDKGAGQILSGGGVASGEIVREGEVVSVEFEGATERQRGEGIGRLAGHHNYFIGNDSRNWASNVPLYARARINGLYAGVDALFYVDAGRPRYDLLVAPGADASRVTMRISGAKSIGVTGEGALAITTGLGTIEQRGLYAYQEIAGARVQVPCRFVVDAGGTVRFDMGAYDRNRPLVIDPLVYSTFVGGVFGESGTGIAVDAEGNAYVCGINYSSAFPTTVGAYRTTSRGADDAFVTKLSADGSSLVYSTYLGGTSTDSAMAIAVDGDGNAYVTGWTASTNFPMQSAYDATNAGRNDVFVTKLNASGSALVYSTYLGGAERERGHGIAVDGSGHAYVTGITVYTRGAAYPTTVGAFQRTHRGISDAFVTKLGTAGSTLVYSTLLGGTNNDQGNGIVVDADGYAFVTGSTIAFRGDTNFPTTTGVYRRAHGGYSDVFVTKLNTVGSALAYSTLIAGDSNEFGQAIAIDGNGDAYVTGSVDSGGGYGSRFPTTAGAYLTRFAGVSEAFVTKLNSTGSSLVYSTFVGGRGYDFSRGIVVDAGGNASITGYTYASYLGATNYPTTAGAVQTTHRGSYDGFMTQLDADGATLLYSTSLGGTGLDLLQGIAIDGNGDLYVTGFSTHTGSAANNYATTDGAFQTTMGGYTGGADVVVTKISTAKSLVVLSPNGGEAGCAGSSLLVTWIYNNVANVTIEISSDDGATWEGIVGVPAADGAYWLDVPASQPAGAGYLVRVSDADDASINDASDASFTISAPPAVTVHPVSSDPTCTSCAATFTAEADGAESVRWQYSIDDGENYTDLDGEVQGSLTIDSPGLEMNGYRYRAVFTNGCGEIASDPAVLYVEDAAGPNPGLSRSPEHPRAEPGIR